jgi:hypothetical protein
MEERKPFLHCFNHHLAYDASEPTVIYRYQGHKYRLDLEMMKKPAPTKQELEDMAAGFKTQFASIRMSGYYSCNRSLLGAPMSGFWQNVEFFTMERLFSRLNMDEPSMSRICIKCYFIGGSITDNDSAQVVRICNFFDAVDRGNNWIFSFLII